MYAKCGALAKAAQVLDDLPVHNVVSWNTLIAGYAQQGQGEEALKCFEGMKTDGLSPDTVTYICSLKACGSIGAGDKGKRIHDEIVRKGLLGKDIVVGTTLVDMYAKCGALTKAAQVLDELPVRNIVSWNALIAGYCQQGQCGEAMKCLERIQHEGLSPDVVTFTCILKACGSIRAVDKGEHIHDEIVRRGLLGKDIFLGTSLVDMYSKCGALAKAAGVLDKLPVRNVVSWNALITGYAQQGQGKEVLKCFKQMQCEGLSPNAITFTCILKACSSIGAIDKGRQIHDEIVRHGLLGKDIVLGNALVDMYAKFGDLTKAAHVLDELPVRDAVSWSALIAGYAEQGRGEEALKCFEQMHREGLFPNVVTFICILKACGSIGAVAKGEQIHNEIAREGLLGNNIVLGNSLVDMYAKCGALAIAERVIDELPRRDVGSWSVLISGYAKQGKGHEALKCFERMQDEALDPNIVTFICLLKACGSIGAVGKGDQIYDVIVRQGLLKKDVMLGNTLVDMYAKCGALAKAARVLDDLPVRDVVSWNALIAGYTQQGQGEEGLKCFERMQSEGLCPDAVTFICLLKACGSIGAIDKGEQIHQEVVRQGLLGKDIVLGTTLVDMYGKCGKLAKAAQVLDELPVRDVVSWNALITGYVRQGEGEEAVNCFKQMRREGLSPTTITLACLLCACSRSGLVDEGQTCFADMSTKYGITPDVGHYTCLVDLFSRAGEFDKALAAIEKMPPCDYLPVWRGLLSACRECGNVKLGRLAFGLAVQIDEDDAAVCLVG